LGDSNLTVTDLPKDNSGQPITARLHYVPRAFQFAEKTPLILGVMTLVLAALTIVLHRNRRLGTSRIAFVFLSSGILIAVVGGIFWFITRNAQVTTADLSSLNVPEFNNAVLEVFRSLSASLAKVYLIHGGVILAFGLLLHGIVKLQRRTPPTVAAPAAAPVDTSETAVATPKVGSTIEPTETTQDDILSE
jgi:hypothetical protein